MMLPSEPGRALPQLLGDKGHEGVQQAKQARINLGQHRPGGLLALTVAIVV